MRRWNRLFKSVAQYSLLFPSTGFDPAALDPKFLWLSRYRRKEPEPEPPTPRGWKSAAGTRPGRAIIGGGRYRSRKVRRGLERARLQGRAPFSLAAGLWSRPAFDWRGWHAGAGPSGGGTGGRGSGRRDEELEEASREMSAAAGSRESESAGPAGDGTLGWGSGAVAGQTLGRAGSGGWLTDARGKDQGPGPTEAETLGLKCCGDVSYS